MNIDENIIEFGNYVETTNYDDDNLNRNKYYHSVRVCNYAKEIAKSIGLDDKDIYIASLAGLLHDISRFNEWIIYGTYDDPEEYDHGDKSYEILKENNYIYDYVTDKEIQNYVLLAAKYHNKYSIPEYLTEKEKQFCNIVRDADKIDIIISQTYVKEGRISKDILKSVKNRKMCKNESVASSVDSKVRNLAFIFDMAYKESLDILIKKDAINNLINIIKENSEDEVGKEIEREVNNYLKEVNLC